MTPTSQMQVRKVMGFDLGSQLLRTVTGLESRFSEFKVYAVCLNPTVDSELQGRVGWAGQDYFLEQRWSEGPGTETDKIHCWMERGIIPSFCREQSLQCQAGHAGRREGASKAR